MGTNRRSDELGDTLVHLRVSLNGVPVLDTQGIKKRKGPIAEALLGVIAAQRVLVGEALDVEQLPGGKGVVEHPVPRPPPDLDLDGAGWVAAEGEGQHGAALGDIDVVVRSAVERAVGVGLPGGGGQAITDDGVVLEDEEEAPLPDGIGLKRSVYVGLLLVS